MQFHQQAQELFNQLQDIIRQLSPALYSKPVSSLNGSSIGQHVRHTVEMFFELEAGYVSGTVNYDDRKRSRRLESDILFAIASMEIILNALNKHDKELNLQCNFIAEGSQNVYVRSTYYRELLYNLEHTIHHMALIRVGVKELTDIELPASFGVAPSTTKHRNQLCAQ